MEATKERWYSTKDLAERWGCHPQTVIRRLRVAGVKPVQLGSGYQVRTSQLQAAEAAMGVEGMYD